MIIGSLGPDVPAFRMHSPRWSFQPLSGAGAGKSGGRLNRIGTDALYLALDHDTAIAEYQQGDPLVRPGLLVSYRLTLNSVVDFSRGYEPANWEAIWQDLSCPWKKLAFLDEVEPASWVIADIVRDGVGAAAILYPSVRRPGGTNLVIYPDRLNPADRLVVHDPQGDLPADQSSWRGVAAGVLRPVR